VESYLLNDSESSHQLIPDTIVEQDGTTLMRRTHITEQQTQTPVINPKPTPQIETNANVKKCHFTGFSNLEIVLLFTIATITTLLFYFEISDIIYNVYKISIRKTYH
jgi:hypothetical protein